MRAVITGTDFVKDIDGSFKAIETNTNIGQEVDSELYVNTIALDLIVDTNNISEIVFITKADLEQYFGGVDMTPITEKNENISGNIFSSFLENYCKNKEITYSKIYVDKNSVTIPYIEDTDDKLIIRNTYDTTALIDDTYARDNWSFLKLMHEADESSIPKTFINDTEFGFDSIGTIVRDNGNYPNYLIKKRQTPSDNEVYPKIYKIDTISELTNLKDNLDVDEYLQEYIFNTTDLLENRIKSFRSVDIIYGPNLDFINLWTMETGNSFEIQPMCDLDDDNQIAFWERPRYLTKYFNSNHLDPKLDADASSKIIKVDGSIVLGEEIQVGDEVKSISIPGLPKDSEGFQMQYWSGSIDTIMTGTSISSAILGSKNLRTGFSGFFYNITTTDGIKFSDVGHAAILCKSEIYTKSVEIKTGTTEPSGSTYTTSEKEILTPTGEFEVKFNRVVTLNSGDSIYLLNNETNAIEEKTIESIKLSFEKLEVYTLDFNELDVFLTMEEETDTPKYGVITHNYLYDCYQYQPANTNANGYISRATCNNCNTESGVNSWYPDTICCRCTPDNNYYGQCGATDYTSNCSSWYQYPFWNPASAGFWDTAYTYNPCAAIGYCNENKPSDTKLKKQIKFIEQHDSGLNVYEFEYNDDIIIQWNEETGETLTGKWRGVMAQELIGTEFENALTKHKDGFYIVNYNLLPKLN